MDSCEKLLKKLNGDGALTLADIMPLSLVQLRELTDTRLTQEETEILIARMQQVYRDNLVFESRLLSRANPQLTRLTHFNVDLMPESRGYDEIFPQRTDSFVAPGSVSSMFSPAAYLTELYRESSFLHPEGVIYNLKKRRPDLDTLLLSQANMDSEISTLSLSNEILLNSIRSHQSWTVEYVMETLSSYRFSGNTPYHGAYSAIRQSILSQDPNLSTLMHSSYFREHLPSQLLMALEMDISPDLLLILTEEISDKNVSVLYENNFGSRPIETLSSISRLVDYYSLSTDEITTLIGLVPRIFPQNINGQQAVDYIESHSFSPNALFLLQLNKIIRLYMASGFSLLEMERILLHVNNQVDFNENLLINLAHTKFLSRQHSISPDDALMLCDFDISTESTTKLISQFDLLFNTPALNDQIFSLDSKAILVNPNQLDPTDSFRRAVLKRAFQVDDATLWLMHQMGCRTMSDSVDNTLDNLSGLYRIAVLARAHALTIDELNTLLLLSPYRATPLYNIDVPTLKSLTQYLFFITEWLTKQKWSVYQLFIMVIDTYGTVWTPTLDDLRQTLRNGIGTHCELKGEALILTMAPFIASSLQLNSYNMSESILRWANQIQPKGQTTETFWALIKKEILSDDERHMLIAFAQTLGQLAIIINSVNISEQELSLLVNKPALLINGITSLGLNIDILQRLTLFHRWINGAGAYVNEVLSALNNGKLTATLLANSLQKDVMQVTLAMEQVVPNTVTLAHWDDVFVVIQWLNITEKLHITSDNLTALMTLTYDKTTAYATWTSLGDMMLGTLEEQQSDTVNSHLKEQLSAALSGYYIQEISPLVLNNRNDLYSYLLIDNQVSGQVKTTRLAEAIASVQLYVYRVLNGQETGTDAEVSSRQFFIDWDSYNARYSSWAGVSQLVYYPENYVDPAMRVGQTEMMDELLQQVSQSSLSSDTVEQGLFNYLTAFDEIANLDIVSGYHDNIDINQGKSYFISFSQTESQKFYWRSVDHSKSQEGTFAANAWSEWQDIACAINPWDMIIHLVRLNSRLFICWIERIEKVSSDGSKTFFTYQLKLSKINYDGSWSAPFSYDISTIIQGISEKEGTLGLFCSEYQGEGTLIIYIYKKESRYTTAGPSSAKGLYIYDNMTRRDLDTTKSDDKLLFDNIKKRTYFTLDTLSEKRVNNIYAEGFITDSKIVSEKSNNDYDFVGEFLDATCTANSRGEVNLKLLPSTNIQYTKVTITSAEEALLAALNKKEKQIVTYNYAKYHTGKPEGSDPTQALVVTIENNQIVINSCAERTDYDYIPAMTADFSSRFYRYFVPKATEYRILNGVLYRSYVIPNDVIDFKSAPKLQDVYWSQTQSSTILIQFRHMSYKQSCVSFLPSDITFSIITKGQPSYTTTAKDSDNRPPAFSRSGTMQYIFTGKNLDITNDFMANESITISCKFSATNVFNVSAETAVDLRITKTAIDPKNYISLHFTPSNVSYMQQSVYRTRLNTLFAKQLISKASTGLNAIYSMATQLLPEPKLGEGTYVTLELSQYDSAIHGSSREFTINYVNVYSNNDKYPLKSGLLSDTASTSITLFVPRIADAYNMPDNLYLQAHYQKGDTNEIRLIRNNVGNSDGWRLDTSYHNGTFAGLISVYGLNQLNEPMDFNGANALYFWELFYYTPALICARLLQDSQYDGALTWLKYIWSPTGYIVQGEKQSYYWNCRPLKEDTSWNTTPLDSVDPDAVAQNDPIHYKLATFMSMLDLLIARGDSAYRQLERDTLNQAKMWYIQALNLLGDEPYVPLNGEWQEPTLASAASKTAQSAYQQALLTLRETGLPATPLTANTLTALFLPEVNSKLQGYWQLLAQRLYNLRHNLSIDGQSLSLPQYATALSPEALQSAAVASAQGDSALPRAVMPLCRFPVMLDNARTLVGQLMDFGRTLQGVIEQQDGEAMAELLQNQACDLSVTSISMQDKTIAEIDADERVLQASRQGEQSRYSAYANLYNENINTGEKQAMDLYLFSSIIATSGNAMRITAAAMDLVPNIYGLAVGGSKYGAMFDALAIGTEVYSEATRIAADRISYNETYRRRREDWALERNNAQNMIKQIDAQLVSLSIRRQAAVLQKSYLETQQSQMQAQLEFLQRKFSKTALYNWLRGCLSAIYYQFYDLTVSRCLMSQEAYRWEMNQPQASFIKPGAWNSTYAGLMAGEKLMLNLTQMEDAYLTQDFRPMEVMRTVSLAQWYAALPNNQNFILAERIKTLFDNGSGQAGTDVNGIKLDKGELLSSVKLADLAIMADYPSNLGEVRRIKQISVTLPILMEPYQDIQAVLSYGGSLIMPQGCSTQAVSHGVCDTGQFQLDFNDACYLPFEGIPINDEGTLTLSFPNATTKQKTLLLSLNDIILHIRYTIYR